MAYKKESLEKLLVLIDEISKEEGNEWFRYELEKKYNNQLTSTKSNIELKVNKISDILEIKGELSIDYTFIDDKLTQNQLVLDNLRMENSRLNTIEKNEIERFWEYCVNAFYQVENALNYYYHSKYPTINDLLNHFENIPGTSFKRNEKRPEMNISEINFSTKLYTFNKTFFNNENDYRGMSLSNLNKVRNYGIHRCTIISGTKNEDPIIFNFFKYNTFNTIRKLLQDLIETIKENIITK